MITEVVQTKEIILKLTVEEAAWLKANMQNPLRGNQLDSEPQRDGEIRRSFFESCAQALAK